MLKEFREFALRGNVLDLAVGIIIGAAFTSIVNSLVNDIIMPPIGVLTGGINFNDLFILLREGNPPGPYPSLEVASAAGAATINYGVFISAVINFLIVALVVFLLVKSINRMARMRKAEEKIEEAAAPDPNQPLIDAVNRLTAAIEKKV